MDDEVPRSQSAAHPERLTPERRLRLQGLTPREAEVALLAAWGFHVREIAQHLQLAPGSVKALLARARQKLGCRDVRELTAVLLREGVVRPEELVDPREERERKR